MFGHASVLLHCRLRVVPLSLSRTRESVNKSWEKNDCVKSLPIKAREFELCVAPTTQKCDWLILGALTNVSINFKICVTSCRNLCSLKIESCTSQAVVFLWFYQQAVDKNKFIKCFVCNALIILTPNASVLMISPLNTWRSTASSENSSVICCP